MAVGKPTTERIKLHSFTKRQLEDLKTEENWTFDKVITFLLDEHDILLEQTDPDFIKEKERDIEDKYVVREQYDEMRKKAMESQEKVNELTDKLEKTIGELKENKENFIGKLKEQQDNYDKLQNELIAKEEKIKPAKIETDNLIQDLNQKLEQSQSDLSVEQKEHKECKDKNDHLRDRLNSGYLLTDRDISISKKVISFLSSFLNRKHFFTAKQISEREGFRGILEEDIEDLIPLFRYDIIPVMVYNRKEDGVKLFGFDKDFLKH